jgi:hypothetical protein
MISEGSNNGLGIAVGSDELEAKALEVMKMARSALFYLAFAIGVEERRKAREKPSQLVGSMSLYGIEDKRKRRDPN